MKFLRFGICALVSIAVVTHGGVEEWARAILETGAGLLFLAYVVRFWFKEREKPSFSPLLPPLTLFFLVVLKQ